MKINFVIVFVIAVFSISCQNGNTDFSLKTSINGFIQKGPFCTGSSVTIYELNSDLSQTGRSFSTQILNNTGYFQVPDIQLNSKYICIKADGYYFNEVTGKHSISQITLYAISDISDKKNINVNVFTHLEKPRIEHLISQGLSFAESKKQAEQEILNFFDINKDDFKTSENLNIVEEGDDNAILLAVSVILQSDRSEGELSELLSNISNDLHDDGLVTDTTLIKEISSRIKFLSLSSIRKNIEEMSKNLGSLDAIPDFEKYIPKSFVISYPVVSKYGLNVLSLIDTVFIRDSIYNQYGYSFAAFLPDGTTLKIEHSGNLGWAFNNQETLDGWDDLGHDESFIWRTLESNRIGLICCQFQVKDTFTLRYFENNSRFPVRIKKILVK